MSVHLDPDFSDQSPRAAHASPCAVEVLILSRDGALISAVESALAGAYAVRHASGAAAAIEVLQERRAGVLITDAPSKGAAFRDLARRLAAQFPHLAIIGVGDHESAVSLIDFFNGGLVQRILLKPLSRDQVRQQVQSAMRQHLLSRGATEAELAAVPAEPADWDEDHTQPQSDAFDAERPSGWFLAEPQFHLSAADSLATAGGAEPKAAATRMSRGPWLIGGSAAAAAVAAVALVLHGSDDDAAPRAALEVEAVPAAVTPVATAPSELQRALAAASVALAEGRYISPAEDNALDHYLAALEIEPHNVKATAGLETIAGVQLQEAQSALARGDFRDALATRRLARDLRPNHSALAFVDAEFAEFGRSLIAAADSGLAPEELAAAGEQLDLAARFLPPGSPDLAAARAALADRHEQRAIEDRLAIAVERMEADNLTVPADDSAEFHLLALRAQYPEDEKVVKGLERLVGMMLERSDAAIVEENVATAADWLDKAEKLGARPEALSARHDALANVRQKVAAQALLSEAAAATDAALQEELALAAAALEEEAVAVAEAEDAAEDIQPLEAVGNEPVQVASTTQILIEPAAGAGALVETGPVEITELEMLHMVEPEYPRRAYVRNIDGWIDVAFTVTATGQTRAIEVTGAKARGWFERAAIEAVEQWQFQPELENGRPVERRAKVRLQFTREE